MVIISNELYRRVSRDLNYVHDKSPAGVERIALDAIDGFADMRGRATWRGGPVGLMDHPKDQMIWIVTGDPKLIKQESATLDGDVHQGGQAIVPVNELSSITLEVVRRLRPDGSDRVVHKYSLL